MPDRKRKLPCNSTVSKSQHVTHRQETKEKKIEKQKKNALRAAYDADPNSFKEELSELHSDIDREEENMVPFSENIAVEMQLAKAAQHEAYRLKGINVKLTPSGVKMNRDLAESLKDGSVFAFKDLESKKGIYKMELLQLGINIMWFTN
ncbi:hypothetical protein BDR06DRAFT_1010587 [Suillus hirtellus]|nr:hypothetical protein BDR06DRAFT_1010587 [Suillus hirtellus]